MTELKFDGMVPISIMFYKEVGHSQEGAKQVTALLEAGAFDGPKPMRLIFRLLTLANTDKNAIILDFFSGSATTAHAVMQLNAEDGGQRKFIMVQLPEPTDEKTEAYKASYKNICEIGKERIRRAGEKVKTEAQAKYDEYMKKHQQSLLDEDNEAPLDPAMLDIGCKVFKLDTSNLRKWQPDYEQLETSLLASVDNYVDGRSELDVIYEIVLKMGLELSLPLTEHDIAGKKVYTAGAGGLMICLADDITTEVAQGMADLKEQYQPEKDAWKVVFKDNGFASDSSKTNIKEILKCAGLDEEAFTTI